jgi:single-stranded-DNA-specific exonuclease
MIREKLWVYKDIDEQEVDRLSKGAGISRLLAGVFVSRGICGQDGIEYVRDFLEPDAARFHDPFLMDGMDKAADRVIRAVDSGESILIYGDYDVDGVTSTSILYNFLTSRGADVKYFIPDRMEDGYGLTMSGAEKARAMKPSLIITVDCGITSVDEVHFLMESGIDVIVTDHHECREILPEAAAVMNPHKPGCSYPFKELSGAGVAFKLIHAVCMRTGSRTDTGTESKTETWTGTGTEAAAGAIIAGNMSDPRAGSMDFMKYIDLAALSTIADIVPLVGENRIIASLGLKAMETTSNKGLEALIKVAGYGGKEISSYAAAFGLAPRVNAAGRLGSAERAVRLFTTGDRVLAEALAKELDEENRLRQATEDKILEEALDYVETKLDPNREKVLVVSGTGWHHGVIGIVSSKVTERYNRPSIVISIDEEGTGKGSARSIRSFNLFKALTDCGDLMERFGGHEMAAGLTISSSNIEELRRRINKYADDVLTDDDMKPCIRVDAFLDRGDITFDSVRELAKMAPYGESNPTPNFGYMALKIADVRTMSQGRHLKLNLCDGGFSAEAVGFNLGELADKYTAGGAVDIVFTPDINVWNGTEKLQLNIRDIRHCVFTNLDKNIVFNISNDYNNIVMRQISSLKGQYRLKPTALVPDRSELEVVYRYIRAYGKNACSKDMRGMQVQGRVSAEGTASFIIGDLYGLSALLSEKYSIPMNFFKLKKALEIFEELGLLKLDDKDRMAMIVSLPESVGKVDLGSSKLYTWLQAVKNCFEQTGS